MSSLTPYLEEYGLLSLEKQQKLARLIGDHSMELDLDAGLIRFSGLYEFPFQILGTESDNTLTWLWAWADEQTEMPRELLVSSLQMKEWGMAAGVPECTSPSLDLAAIDGTVLSLVASEVCRASCYYKDRYEGGALFLLLSGKEIEAQPSLDAGGFELAFLELVSLDGINHRNALLSYLRGKGLSFDDRGALITAELASGETFRAEFDDSGRLTAINGRGVAQVR